MTLTRPDAEDPFDSNRILVRGLVYEPAAESISASSGRTFTTCNGDDILVGGLVPLLGTATQVNLQGENVPHTLTASAEVKARAFDLIWNRRTSLRSGWEMGWSAGLRYLEFDLDAAGVYTTDTPEAVIPSCMDPGCDSYSTESVEYSSEASGIGPLVGGSVGYRWGAEKRFGVYGSMEVGGLFGEADWSYRSFQRSFDSDPPPPDRVLADLSSKGSHRTITTVDLDLGVSWRFRQWGELRGGWRSNYWKDVWTDLDLVDASDPRVESIGTHLEPAEFQGLFVGLQFEF
jgi:hypothetical protein